MILSSPLQTDRLILRELTPDDFDAIHEYCKDPATVRFQFWGPDTEADTRDFMESRLKEQQKKNRKIYTFAITLKDSGKLIGDITLWLEKNNTGTVGYDLNSSYWGNGYATEALKRMLLFGKDTFALKRFEADCDVLNLASRNVLEKCDFQIYKKRKRKVHGRMKDYFFFELLFS